MTEDEYRDIVVRANKPLHTELRAARFGEINVVGRDSVNGDGSLMI